MTKQRHLGNGHKDLIRIKNKLRKLAESKQPKQKPIKLDVTLAKEIADNAVRDMVIQERTKIIQSNNNKLVESIPGAIIAIQDAKLLATLTPVKGIDK